jgi:hypothetical protein
MSEENSWRYCPNCGETVLQGSNFCSNCGYKIGHLTIAVVSQIPKQSVPQPTFPVTVKQEKSTSITAAAILFFIFGILGTGGSLFLIAGSIAFGILPLIGLGGIIPGFIGIAWFIIAIFTIVAGIELWRSRRIGGVIGMVSSMISIGAIMTFAILAMYPFSGDPGIAAFARLILGSLFLTPVILLVALNLISIILLIIGWKSLT